MIKYENILIPPDKAAKIVENWRAEEDVSLTSLHRTVQYSYDVIYNVFGGKNKDTSLERMSRISLALGHSLEEFCEAAFGENEELLQELFPSRKKLREIQALSCEKENEFLSERQVNPQTDSTRSSHEHAATEVEIELFNRFTKMRDEHEHKMEEEYKTQYNEMKAMYERIIAKQEETIAAQAKKITKLIAMASEKD